MKKKTDCVDPISDFVKGGLLGERVYAPEEDEDEEGGDETTPYDQAKIDPSMPQSVPDEVAAKAGVKLGDAEPQAQGPEQYPAEPAEGDPEAVEPGPEAEPTDGEPAMADDGEEGDPEATDDEDPEADPEADPELEEGDTALPQLGIGVFAEALCRMLGSAKFFAEAMKQHEHQFVETYGAERLPILNEVVHKLTTAEDMLGSCLAPPDDDPNDGVIVDEDDDEVTDDGEESEVDDVAAEGPDAEVAEPASDEEGDETDDDEEDAP